MDASQVDFNRLKNVTCKKLINYDIVVCWYAELKHVLIITVVVSTNYFSNQTILSILIGDF